MRCSDQEDASYNGVFWVICFLLSFWSGTPSVGLGLGAQVLVLTLAASLCIRNSKSEKGVFRGCTCSSRFEGFGAGGLHGRINTIATIMITTAIPKNNK
eukprot:6486682-Amphidinium_carterae.1